jgi:hypothetical protein
MRGNRRPPLSAFPKHAGIDKRPTTSHQEGTQKVGKPGSFPRLFVKSEELDIMGLKGQAQFAAHG